MVCPLGSGRMAAMARLLAAGSFSQTIAEEVGHQKLAVQYIHRELREADEANLLDEEDMHIFGLKPMTDPLHLVCCNACKKPVRVSQYTAHAELCKSLNSAEEVVSELGGGTGHRKPPRKEKKKLLNAYANLATSVGDKERFDSADADGITAPESHLDEQIQTTSSFSMETKYAALTKNGSGVNPGSTDNSTGALPPPIKRSKLIGAEGLPLSNHLEVATAVTKSLCTSTQEALTYVPVPLATKMFYSQTKHRLRSALTHLYFEASSMDYCADFVNPKLLEGNTKPSQTSSPKNFSHEQLDDPLDKRDKNLLPSVQKLDQILAHNSEVYTSKSGGCPPAMNVSNQAPVNSVLRAHTAPVGMTRSNFLSQPYSFAGNSGRTIGTMQQPNGSVPVT